MVLYSVWHVIPVEVYLHKFLLQDSFTKSLHDEYAKKNYRYKKVLDFELKSKQKILALAVCPNSYVTIHTIYMCCFSVT